MLRAPSLVSNFAAEIDLAVPFSGPNAGPKAKENGRLDHERDHNCVPQRHGAISTSNLVNEFQMTSSRCLDVGQAASSTFKGIKVG